ncbi:transporter [Agaricicola taiwanensis]|uniref:Transporter n=1 Tax=Agaricicola taiwanensis TaxID=591372 RepID=A0A8J2VV82_9RHOB|nr:DMT family transporter [Agaricicola taiwanensis]GGE39293.1 transporter [Agaricicola taiwanensis]
MSQPPRFFGLYDRPYLLLSLTSLFWATNIVLGRFIAGSIPPITLAWVRWAAAAVILAPFAWHHVRRDWPALRERIGVVIVLSLTGITLYNTMAYIGLTHTQALNALLLQSTVPVMIAVMTFFMYGDRLTGRQLSGILTSMLGVVTIICRGDPRVLLSVELNQGDIWMLSALAIYAFYSAVLRKKPQVHPLSLLCATITLGAILLTPFFLWELSTGARPVVSAATVAVFVYVAIFPSLVAYLFFNRGVELIGANRTGPFFHLMPLFGSAIAILFLGERPMWFHALGYALVVTGIFLATRRSRPEPQLAP